MVCLTLLQGLIDAEPLAVDLPEEDNSTAAQGVNTTTEIINVILRVFEIATDIVILCTFLLLVNILAKYWLLIMDSDFAQQYVYLVLCPTVVICGIKSLYRALRPKSNHEAVQSGSRSAKCFSRRDSFLAYINWMLQHGYL